MTTKYKVSADHVVAKHACADVICEPELVPGTDLWSVTIAGYGCSKAYSKPRDAIYGMLAEHACTFIRVTEVTS